MRLFCLIQGSISKYVLSVIIQMYNWFSNLLLNSGNFESMHFVENLVRLVT